LQDHESPEPVNTSVPARPIADEARAGPSTPTPIRKQWAKKPTPLPVPPTPVSGGTKASASKPASAKATRAALKRKGKEVAETTETALVEPVSAGEATDLPPTKKPRVDSEEM
jgi:hypothetical protein